MDRLSEIKDDLRRAMGHLCDPYALSAQASVNCAKMNIQSVLDNLESLQSDQCAGTRKAMHVSELSDEELDSIEKSRVPEKYDYLDAELEGNPAPPVSGTDWSGIRIVEKYDTHWRVNGKDFFHEPTKEQIVEAYGVKPVARDEKGVYVPLTMSRNMKSRALAHGIDPERLAEAWISIINARPLAYQSLPQPPEES